ncbi:bifunctional diaminohydroxyphosphoribosylaminopyrimidine deaminase/5-amino-6-(5-phosphoribosylamino)uracil reductase RibD [Streptomyces sp. NPDC050509]|uniref:bifunctional diaminohydroxyphosphoribosylaminopyrimidine deaminase/5-amino-6-(5-phosphoribosylamino)uracil reductase RibD n=1 Tax=Streptomyces sp. NPDC050509 TaxID=3365620 RepID=UPI00378D9AF9
MATAREFAAMRRAIAISAQGLGSTSPNPPVGCVILDIEGKTVGEGYHVRKGESHAEVNALAAAGERAQGGTAVVTLEPCNHFGRTPPCRAALITAKVTRVIIAVTDPTSRGAGGTALLREAGVDVEQDFLKNEALLVLDPWLASLKHDRPFVTWIYEGEPDGTPNSRDAAGAEFNEVRAIREAYDFVVHQDGKIEEGNPGSHSTEAFQVPSEPLKGKPAEVLHMLGEAGARTVLVRGASEYARTLHAVGAVDQVISYIPSTPHSWTPGESPIAIPEGYRLTDVTSQGGYVRMVGRLLPSVR